MSKKNNGLAAISGALKGYGNIMGERSKLMSQLLANQIEAKSNWFYKMQEQELQNKNVMDVFKQSRQGGQPNIDEDVFSSEVKPSLRYGNKGGAELYYPSQKDFIYSQIQAKKKKGMGLSEKESKFIDEYMFDKQPKESTQKQVVDLAIKLAESEGGGFASQEDIQKKMPIAQQMLEGKTEVKLEDNVPASKEIPANQYTPDQEQTIQDNMKAYGKTREEIIQALTKRNLL